MDQHVEDREHCFWWKQLEYLRLLAVFRDYILRLLTVLQGSVFRILPVLQVFRGATLRVLPA